MKIGWIFRAACIAALAASCGYSVSLSKCDVNHNGSTAVSDVQGIINEALGAAQPVDDLNSDTKVNVVDVQIDMNAVLLLGCIADPGLVSVVPNTAIPGDTAIPITINGRLTNFTNASTVDLGAGITVSNIAATSATVLTATVTVSPTAAIGNRDLTVDGLTLAKAFAVVTPVSVAYTYDSQGRLATATYTGAAGATTVVTYSYDAAGNRTSVVAH